MVPTVTWSSPTRSCLLKILLPLSPSPPPPHREPSPGVLGEHIQTIFLPRSDSEASIGRGWLHPLWPESGEGQVLSKLLRWHHRLDHPAGCAWPQHCRSFSMACTHETGVTSPLVCQGHCPYSSLNSRWGEVLLLPIQHIRSVLESLKSGGLKEERNRFFPQCPSKFVCE